METGKIVSWLKSPGDAVEKGDNILVVESDKADMDVESFHSGILASIVVAAGESAPVGSAIALIAETEAEVDQAKQKAANLSAASSATPAPAPAAKATPAPIAKPAPAPSPAIAPIVRPTSDGRVVASPLAKKRATELGVDIQVVVGSGPGGRIVEADVQKAASQGTAKAPAAPAPKSIAPANIPLGQTVPLTTLQSAVVRSMSVSLDVPTFQVSYSIITTALDALYKQVKPKGVTMTGLLAKAVATVLEKHPLLNAAYTNAGIHYKADINIAVAVAMDDGGLITPVLQQANWVDLYELSRRWKDLVNRARLKQLQPEEYSTGSFTISNLGMFGVDQFVPILPPNHGSILAIGASKPTVTANTDGSIAVRNQMIVTITCDHRVIYGAHAAAFLQDLAHLLQENATSLTL